MRYQSSCILKAVFVCLLFVSASPAQTSMRVKEDRELEENKFIPSRTVFGAARSRNNFQGGAWPYNYPRP